MCERRRCDVKPPLQSFDAVEWWAWSDWCADCGRDKAAAVGKQVGKALLKLASVGAAYGAVLVLPYRVLEAGRSRTLKSVVTRRGKGPILSGWWKAELIRTAIPYGMHFDLGKVHWWSVRQARKWLQANSLPREPAYLTPADIDTDKYTRLAWRFWRLTVRRATGVKEVSGADSLELG